MRIFKVVLVSICKVYWKSCYNKIKRRAYFVKHFVYDLAGRLSTPRFLPNVNGLALHASSINIGQKNFGVLQPAKSFIECLTCKHVI